MDPVDPGLAGHGNEMNLSVGARKRAQENEKCKADDGETEVWPTHILEGCCSRTRFARSPEIRGHARMGSLTDLSFQDVPTRTGTPKDSPSVQQTMKFISTCSSSTWI